jgi:hypothetical protein
VRTWSGDRLEVRVADNLEDAALVLLVEGVDEAGEIEGAESGRLAAMTSFI